MDWVAKALLVLHGAAAVVLIGSCTHNGVLALAHLRGRALRPKLRRMHARISLWAFAVTYALGMTVYPDFRVDVRAGYLDEHLPVATGLFEIKEHWLALGIGIVLAHAWLSRRIDVRERSNDAVLYDALGIALVLVVWMSFFTGLTLAAIKPLGG